MTQFLKNKFPFLLLTLFSLLIIFRIFHSGFFIVHDDTQPTRIFEMTKSIKEGLFPVRWVDDLGFGYGYPIFNFYAPFPYYLGSFFNIIGFDSIASAKIMYAIPVLVAGIGMYLFIKTFLGVIPALGGSVVYLLFPYFAVNIFIRGAVGEYYAYSLLPYIFLGFFKIYYLQKNTLNSKKTQRFWSSIRKDFKYISLTALTISMLIISHNLSAYMFSLMGAIFIILTTLFSKNKKILNLKYILILVLTFLISSFYILPAIFEMHYTNVNSQLKGDFSFINHFVCLNQYWDSPWGFAGSTKGCLDGLSFRLGKSNIIFVLLSLFIGLYFILKKKKFNGKSIFLYFNIVLFLSLFLTLEMSNFIWKVMPAMKYLQFPWRFLNYIGLSMAILIAFFIYFSQQLSQKFGKITLTFVIFLTLFLNLKLFSPQYYIYQNLSDYTEINKIKYQISKISSEYMPSDFERPKSKNDLPLEKLELSDNNKITKISKKTGNLIASFTLKNKTTVKINQAYFPSWSLKINGQDAHLEKTKKGMQFSVGPGNVDIELKLGQTSLEFFSNLLTICGLIIIFIGIIRSSKKNDKNI